MTAPPDVPRGEHPPPIMETPGGSSTVPSPPEPPPLIQASPFRGLSWRVALLASGVVIAVIAILGLLVERTTAERAHTEFRTRSFALLEAIAVPCALDVALSNFERLDDTLTELVRTGRRDLGIRYVALLDDSGHALAHSDGGTFDDGLARAASSKGHHFGTDAIAAMRPIWRYSETPEGQDALLVSMPVVSGLRWGTLIAVIDGAIVEERIAWSRRFVLLTAAVIAVALVGAIYLGMLGLIIRPLRRLGHTVRKVQAGDLSARANLASRHEIGQLGAGFDAMAESLQSYTRDLERRVAERTAESMRRQDALEEVNRQLASAVGELAVLACTDGLTGITNRRHFLELFQLELERSARRKASLVVAMLDIDHFKQVNDAFGHENGDIVLCMVADGLRRGVRGTDIVARFGGEEFVVVLLDTTADKGFEVIARVCAEISAARATTKDGREMPATTLSAGIAAYPEDAALANSELLLRLADEALYAAKATGRDNVVRWRRDVHPTEKSQSD